MSASRGVRVPRGRFPSRRAVVLLECPVIRFLVRSEMRWLVVCTISA
jgi:hypothetical protein